MLHLRELGKLGYRFGPNAPKLPKLDKVDFMGAPPEDNNMIPAKFARIQKECPVEEP